MLRKVRALGGALADSDEEPDSDKGKNKKREQTKQLRRALVREYKGKEDQYAGEKTGIKTHISRSVKLK